MLDIRWAKCRLQSPWLMRPIPFSLKIQSKWEIVSIYLIREKEGVLNHGKRFRSQDSEILSIVYLFGNAIIDAYEWHGRKRHNPVR